MQHYFIQRCRAGNNSKKVQWLAKHHQHQQHTNCTNSDNPIISSITYATSSMVLCCHRIIIRHCLSVSVGSFPPLSTPLTPVVTSMDGPYWIRQLELAYSPVSWSRECVPLTTHQLQHHVKVDIRDVLMTSFCCDHVEPSHCSYTQPESACIHWSVLGCNANEILMPLKP